MVTRRRLIQAAAAGVAVAASPTILAPVTSARTLVARPAAQTAGTLVVGLVAEPTSLDPGQLTDINSMKLLGAMYDTLVRFKPNSFDVEPSRALSWDRSADGLLYTFKLRPGVKPS
jgi:peptide/nickel transport system substrate-binding protein